MTRNQIDLIEFLVKSVEQLNQAKELVIANGGKIIADTYSFPGEGAFISLNLTVMN